MKYWSLKREPIYSKCKCCHLCIAITSCKSTFNSGWHLTAKNLSSCQLKCLTNLITTLFVCMYVCMYVCVMVYVMVSEIRIILWVRDNKTNQRFLLLQSYRETNEARKTRKRMMTGEHVRGGRGGRETARCCWKCKESFEAIILICFLLIIISHCVHTPTPSSYLSFCSELNRMHIKSERVLISDIFKAQHY